jgi:dihydropteroate synthase
MGIVNVTPDSFSDGGKFWAKEAAIGHGLQLIDDGADIIDVGGESTRPGSQPVGVDEEIRRVIPVIKALAGQGAVVSIDTLYARVAEAAAEAGATIINDVSGGLVDQALPLVARDRELLYIASHWRGRAETLDLHVSPVAEVLSELKRRTDELLTIGLDPGKVAVDPGLGFAKNSATNWALLAGVKDLHTLGFPVLIGASRKRFLGELLADDDGNQRGVEERDIATAAISALAALNDVWAVRVHNVSASRDAIAVAAAWSAAFKGSDK